MLVKMTKKNTSNIQKNNEGTKIPIKTMKVSGTI